MHAEGRLYLQKKIISAFREEMELELWHIEKSDSKDLEMILPIRKRLE